MKRESTNQWTLVDSISSLPVGYEGENTGADIHFHPNGRFLYASNRGHNSLVILAIDLETGSLELVGHQPVEGAIPRNFALTQDGSWLLVANQNSGTISSFRVDRRTGRLSLAGSPAKVPTPVCIQFLPLKE